MVNWEGCGRKRSLPRLANISTFLWRDRGHETPQVNWCPARDTEPGISLTQSRLLGLNRSEERYQAVLVPLRYLTAVSGVPLAAGCQDYLPAECRDIIIRVTTAFFQILSFKSERR